VKKELLNYAFLDLKYSIANITIKTKLITGQTKTVKYWIHSILFKKNISDPMFITKDILLNTEKIITDSFQFFEINRTIKEITKETATKKNITLKSEGSAKSIILFPHNPRRSFLKLLRKLFLVKKIIKNLNINNEFSQTEFICQKVSLARDRS